MIVPVDHLPVPFDTLAPALPAAALSDALRVALGGGGDATGSLAVLAVWGIGAVLIATRTFRWE
jgi:ABC-2 type transport system permease protein